MRGRKPATSPLFGEPGLDNPAYATDIIKFLEEQFYIGETKAPIRLFPWQKRRLFIPTFYAEPRPTMAVWSVPKKSGKSTMSAAIGCWFLFTGPPGAELYFAARDLEQASLVNFRRLTTAIRLNKEMLGRVKIAATSVENTRTGTTLRCLPADISAAGLNSQFVAIDELWAFNEPRLEAFYDEISVAPPTIQSPLVLVTTYAGFADQTDSILWRLYEKGIKGEHDERFFFYWDHVARCPWHTKRYLQGQRSRLRPNVYARLWENRWVQSESTYHVGVMEQDSKPDAATRSGDFQSGSYRA